MLKFNPLKFTNFLLAGDWRCIIIDSTPEKNRASQRLQVEVGQAAIVGWVNIAGSVDLTEGEK